MTKSQSRGGQIKVIREPPQPSYEDRMEAIIIGLTIGPMSEIKRKAAAFIQEQAAMVVRLENELRTAYEI